MGVATASLYRFYDRMQKGLLQNMADDLKALGIQKAPSFTKEDLESIQALKTQMSSFSKPLSLKMLTSPKPVVFEGFESQAVAAKFIKSPNYQRIAQKLGTITNFSRRENLSDISVMDSYMVVTIGQSPTRKFLRILADDEEYRYSESAPRQNSKAGNYYFPSTPILAQAFDGEPQVTHQLHSDQLYGTVITAAIPLKNQQGQVVAVLGLNVNVSNLAKSLEKLKDIYLHLIIGSLLCSLLVAFLLSSWLTRPIQKLYQASEKVRLHDFDVTITINSNDEFQLLADTFNSMVAEIRSYTHNLEELVSQRTAELTETKQELENDLEKGQKLQRDFLPEPLPQLPNLELVAVFEPAKKVAGDFYDVFLLPDNLVGLVIADVCDKGVGAAMFMGLFRSFIRLFSGQLCAEHNSSIKYQNTGDLSTNCNTYTERALKAIEITNNYISKEHARTGMFATIFFCVLNPQTGLLTYINGGHEPLYVINRGGVKEILAATGPAVGMFPDVHYQIRQVQLDVGDILLGYTDGVTDARSPNGEFFSSKRLRLLLEQPVTSASQLLERIKTEVLGHVDSAPQFDDITLLAVQYLVEPHSNAIDFPS